MNKKTLKIKPAWFSNKEKVEMVLENALNEMYHLEDVCDYDLLIGEMVNKLQKIKVVEE